MIPGLGNLAEGLLDGLGAPEWLGDIASGVVNFFTGNYPALIGDAVDLFGGDDSKNGSQQAIDGAIGNLLANFLGG
jgi:hypothetical protein